MYHHGSPAVAPARIDNSKQQLTTARRLQPERSLDFPHYSRLRKYIPNPYKTLIGYRLTLHLFANAT
jgi:hypothetical protein